MIQFRDMNNSDEDFEALVDIIARNHPDWPVTVEGMKHFENIRNKELLYRRIFAVLDDRITGVATVGQSEFAKEPGLYFLGIEVYPESRRQGIGSQLYDHAMSILQQQHPQTISAITYEDQADSVRFVEKRGFQCTQRDQRSFLDLEAFDGGDFKAWADRTLEAGITIKPFPDLLDSDPDAKQKLYDLYWLVWDDVPSTHDIKPQALDRWWTMMTTAPHSLPEGWYVAVDGDDYAGLTMLVKDSTNPDRLLTQLTGVKRSHRRMGIAMALKLHAFEFAKAYGAKRIEADNEENNPMLQINYKLGFQPLPARLVYEKHLEQSS